MGFALAEAFVIIGSQDGAFLKSISNVKKQVASLRPQFEALQDLAKKFLVGAGVASAYAIRNYADEERGQQRLRSALAATGQEVNNNAARLIDFADQMQDVTIYSNDAITGQMAYATNLGITADKMEDVIKLGIGLGESLYGGDEMAGIEAVAKAREGSFKALERSLPILKKYSTAQEKMALVVKFGNEGFQQAQDRVSTLEGRLRQLWNTTNDASKGFGKILGDSLKSTIALLRGVGQWLTALTPQQKEQIIHWGKVAAAIALVFVEGPKLVAFFGMITSTLTGLANVAIAVGTVMGAALVSPFGLILLGASLVIESFALLTESGREATRWIGDGFKQLWDQISFVFKNSETLGQAWSGVMAELGFVVSDAWAIAKNAAVNVWITGCNLISNIWNGTVDYLADKFALVGPVLQGVWNSITDYIRDSQNALGDYLAEKWIRLQGKIHGKSPQDIEKEVAYSKTVNTQDKELQDARRVRDKKLADEIAARKAASSQASQQGQHDRDEALARDRAANNKSLSDTMETNAKKRKDFEDNLKQQHSKSGLPSIADGGVFGTIAKALGFDKIQQQIDKLKANVANAAKAGGAANPGVRTGMGKDGGGSSVEDVFKANIRGAFEGEQELKRQQLKQQQDNTSATKDNTDALTALGSALNDALANGQRLVFTLA